MGIDELLLGPADISIHFTGDFLGDRGQRAGFLVLAALAILIYTRSLTFCDRLSVSQREILVAQLCR